MSDRRKDMVFAALLGATCVTEAEDKTTLLVEMLMPGSGEEEHLERFGKGAEFMRLSGSTQGEVLFRWMAQAGLHACPERGWASVGAEVRLFFDVIAAILGALRPLLDPEPAAHKTVIAPVDEAPDTVMTERIGGRFERTYGFDTRGVVVTPAVSSPATVGEMFRGEGLLSEGAQSAIRAQDYPHGPPRGLMPTADEMARMAPEDRRRYIHLDPRFQEVKFPSKAPPVDSFVRETLETPFGTAQVLVPQGLSAPQQGREDGPGAADPASGLPASSEGHDETKPAADQSLIPLDRPPAGDAGETSPSAPASPPTSRRKGKQ
jgi:hypothetical protein